MPPHRGQGLNHAIQDAYNLVNILSDFSKLRSSGNDTKGQLAEKIQDYSDEVAKRGAEEVNMSKQNAMMTLDWNLLQNSPFMKHGLNKSPAQDSQKSDAGGSEDRDERN